MITTKDPFNSASIDVLWNGAPEGGMFQLPKQLWGESGDMPGSRIVPSSKSKCRLTTVSVR
ncbi:MAG: hypothetical protein IPM86_06395 [Saprospiraceae bacterium]|nr:hypothetical protein [Saprospiraceae bacterium]